MFIVKSVVSMRVVVMLQVYRLHTELSRRSYVTWVTVLTRLEVVSLGVNYGPSEPSITVPTRSGEE